MAWRAGPAWRSRASACAIWSAQTHSDRALDSLRFDISRIQRYLDRGIRPTTRGAAIFACGDRGLFEVVDVDVPFATAVTLRPLPDLSQLAQLEAWDVHSPPIHPGEPEDLLAAGGRGSGWRLV